MNGLDASKLPAGLLLAAALVHFAPQWANGPGLLALAVGAWAASAMKLKGVGSIAALVIVAALFGIITGLSSPGLNDIGNRLPVDQLRIG